MKVSELKKMLDRCDDEAEVTFKLQVRSSKEDGSDNIWQSVVWSTANLDVSSNRLEVNMLSGEFQLHRALADQGWREGHR